MMLLWVLEGLDGVQEFALVVSGNRERVDIVMIIMEIVHSTDSIPCFPIRIEGCGGY